MCNFDNITLKKEAHEMRVLDCAEMQMLIGVLLQDTDLYKLGVFLCHLQESELENCALSNGKIYLLKIRLLRLSKQCNACKVMTLMTYKRQVIIITEPKSFASVRVIPIPEFVVEVIKPYQRKQNAYLLSGESKYYIEPRTMQNHFKRYLRDCGIEDANFYSLRHTFATRCVEAGFAVKTLSEILDHSSVKITLDKYVRSSMDLKRMNMEKLQLALP